jgi:hypothetical protein
MEFFKHPLKKKRNALLRFQQTESIFIHIRE